MAKESIQTSTRVKLTKKGEAKATGRMVRTPGSVWTPYGLLRELLKSPSKSYTVGTLYNRLGRPRDYYPESVYSTFGSGKIPGDSESLRRQTTMAFVHDNVRYAIKLGYIRVV